MSTNRPHTIADLYDVLMIRFDHSDELLDVIATTVNRHETILERHTSEFVGINKKLDHHEKLLDAIATTVNRHESLLEKLVLKTDQHEELLDTLSAQSLHNMQVLDRLDPQVKVNSERLNYVELKVARLEFAK
jgi:predicted  nucleic acid-binding Zn-ribbon protein